MHRPRHRVAATLAAGLAALAFATPALAGSDGCDDDGCQAENSPARVVPAPPQPVTLAPAPSTPDRTAERGAVTVTVAQPTTAPSGAVGAGAGGTAPHGPDALLAGLATAGVALLMAGGGLAASGRRSES
jgi:hypothetical protein